MIDFTLSYVTCIWNVHRFCLFFLEMFCFTLAQSAASITGAALAYGTTSDSHSPLHMPDFSTNVSSTKLITIEALSTFFFTLSYFASVDRGQRLASSHRAVCVGLSALGAHLFSVSNSLKYKRNVERYEGLTFRIEYIQTCYMPIFLINYITRHQKQIWTFAEDHYLLLLFITSSMSSRYACVCFKLI